jgi:hypothetical protein
MEAGYKKLHAIETTPKLRDVLVLSGEVHRLGIWGASAPIVIIHSIYVISIQNTIL